ncbi:transcription termination factor MTERF5, chloroplastic-like [Argentina anserina]|uniref:transcription termination factor MTERF5, chloroplastic-like n=1 Tax=Argentina anserina TaxID=57926 RepID=UPI00217672C1|nr:transcription termination factor MTERF5, chloroplastic-like [Potentilla anserina]
MFGFCFRRLQSLVPSCSSISVQSSATRFQKASPFSRLYSSLLSVSEIDDVKPKDAKDQSFTVSYLINTIGFPPEVALSLSKKRRVRFRSPKQPDSVIRHLKDYGFSDTDVSQMVKKHPALLLVSAERTLVPKLEFLCSIGITGTDLTRLLCRKPVLLNYSLEISLRPCYNIIKTLPIGDGQLGLFLRNWCRILSVRVLQNAASNVAYLRSLQVPEYSISLCASYYLFAVSRDTAKFKEYVGKVISMGFSPSSTTFVKAVYVFALMKGKKWSERLKHYREWGWAEDDVLTAFRKSPSFMFLSVENVSIKLDFFVNNMGWQPADIAEHPAVLTYSMEKWIIPRCSVIRILLLKGLIREGEYSIASLMLRRDPFLNRFVNKYQEQVPELLSIYEGKLV